jgi:hypothetical protein
MRRELWAIGNAFGYAIRILNSAFCDGTEEDYEKELDTDETWLVAEQVNGLCSEMMIDDASDILAMIQSVPKNRLCEQINCIYHHPENPKMHNFCHFQDKCDICDCNAKSKAEPRDKRAHFNAK